MKKIRVAALFAACILVIASLYGCKRDPGTESSSLPESSAPPVSSSEPASSLPGESSSEPASSTPEGASSTPATTGEEVTTIVTSDKEFNKLFEKNPIDAAYKKEMADATSNTEIIAVAEKYTLLWQDEIVSGFQKLMNSKAPADKKESFRTKQSNWEADTPAALEKIAADAQAAGGSMAQVDIAGQTMEHYRARAAAIYKNLYAYDKEFTYSFQ